LYLVYKIARKYVINNLNIIQNQPFIFSEWYTTWTYIQHQQIPVLSSNTPRITKIKAEGCTQTESEHGSIYTQLRLHLSGLSFPSYLPQLMSDVHNLYGRNAHV
jgi:hypothetical protein